MYLGRVVGCVWATVKDPGLKSLRMLVVQPVTPGLRDAGKRIVCTDWAGAGAGEIVYWVRSREASFPFLPQEPPTDATVVGIVDSVHVKGPETPAAAVAPDTLGGRPARRAVRRPAAKGRPC
jgi:microcompartment protein CcmK/EutM